MIQSNQTISIVLPVFNGENTVLKAIQSIQQQTFTNWELIIVDDESNDNSYKLCLENANFDKRINVYQNNKNLGLAKTMNRLISLSNGKYIAIQEQDDCSLPDRLEKEIRILDHHHEVGIVSGIARWIDNQGQFLTNFPGFLSNGNQYPQDFQSMVSFLYTEQCKVVNSACMVRRSVFDLVEGPFDPNAKMSIDWQFFIHAAHFIKIWGIPEALVTMLRDSTHTHLTQNKQLQFIEARRCIQIIYDKYKYDPKSPINNNLLKRALVTQQLLECRHFINIHGFLLLIKSIFMTPFNPKIFEQIDWYWQKLMNKIARNFQST